MEQIGQITNNCATKSTLLGCADNVPYMLIVNDGCCSSSTLSYINLNTGEILNTMPTNFTIGECSTTCEKIYKDACANGVPYMVIIYENCANDVAGIEYINLITGGKTSTAPANLQYWSCESVPTQSCVPTFETETFVATAGQTSFTLTNSANGDVRLSRNGSTLRDLAAVVSGNNVTYVPSANNNEVLLNGDVIDISYIYVVCDQSYKAYTDCIGNDLPTDTAIVTCEALNPDHFEINPSTGEISSKCCSVLVQSYFEVGTTQTTIPPASTGTGSLIPGMTKTFTTTQLSTLDVSGIAMVTDASGSVPTQGVVYLILDGNIVRSTFFGVPDSTTLGSLTQTTAIDYLVKDLPAGTHTLEIKVRPWVGSVIVNKVPNNYAGYTSNDSTSMLSTLKIVVYNQ